MMEALSYEKQTVQSGDPLMAAAMLETPPGGEAKSTVIGDVETPLSTSAWNGVRSSLALPEPRAAEVGRRVGAGLGRVADALSAAAGGAKTGALIGAIGKSSIDFGYPMVAFIVERNLTPKRWEILPKQLYDIMATYYTPNHEFIKMLPGGWESNLAVMVGFFLAPVVIGGVVGGAIGGAVAGVRALIRGDGPLQDKGAELGAEWAVQLAEKLEALKAEAEAKQQP